MSRSSKAMLRALDRIVEEGPTHEPFSHDHKVYPQGWSWAMIEREAERRYRSVRDSERKYEWIWAVDDPAVFGHMSREARQAAHELYEHRQTAIGDIERLEQPRGDKGFHYLGASWSQARSQAIARQAERYVRSHPLATEAKLAVFDVLFDPKQPTLEAMRQRARANGERTNAKGKPIKLGHRLMIDRIVWCCEALADCDAGLTAGYGPAR